MKLNKYRPFAYIYFFVNSVGLPYGLLYTTLFTPFFYLWLLLNGKEYVLAKFLVVGLPIAAIHIYYGVELKYYGISTLLLLSNYIYIYTLKTYLEKSNKLDILFNKITIFNFILTLIALVFINSEYVYSFWTSSTISNNLNNFKRLTLFTYEPSYYSTLLAPVILFYIASLIHKPQKKHIYYLLLLLFSLALSFALGIILCLFFAVAILLLIRFKKYYLKRNFIRMMAVVVALFSGLLIGALIFYPDNAFFVRIDNYIDGKDTSGNGRTTEAFMLAYKIAEEKSLAFGVGPGQIKIVGDPIIRAHYGYTDEHYEVVTIPNVAAETIAIFGLVGFAVRILLQFYLFYRTKTYNSNFRLMLFIYIFIYQFTGSYITNIAEYTIWVLAFVPSLDHFEEKIEPQASLITS